MSNLTLDAGRAMAALPASKSIGDRIADVVIHCVLIAMVFLTVIPFYYMVVVSFAPYQDVAGGAFYLIPRHIDFAS